MCTKTQIIAMAMALFFFSGLSACAPSIQQHGNMLQAEQIQTVKAGEHTRSDVLRLLGSPTTQAPFDTDTWYYIGQESKKHGILDAKITEEKVVIISFNDQGLVEKVDTPELERAEIPIADEKTTTHGNKITILQQFLGNIGRFNGPETN